jgi:hypothetical protein
MGKNKPMVLLMLDVFIHCMGSWVYFVSMVLLCYVPIIVLCANDYYGNVEIRDP